MIIFLKWFPTAAVPHHNLVFREGPHPAGRDGALSNRASAHYVRDPVRVPSSGRGVDVPWPENYVVDAAAETGVKWQVGWQDRMIERRVSSCRNQEIDVMIRRR